MLCLVLFSDIAGVIAKHRDNRMSREIGTCRFSAMLRSSRIWSSPATSADNLSTIFGHIYICIRLKCMIIKMNLDPGDNRTMSASQVLLNEPVQHSGILLVFSMDGIYVPKLHWCFQSQLILCRKTLLQNKNMQLISTCQKVFRSHEMKHSEQGYSTNVKNTLTTRLTKTPA